MFFQSKDNIFSLNLQTNNKYQFNISEHISDQDITNIASFLFLLSYSSPISVEIIDKLKQAKNGRNSHIIDKILDSWATLYINDKYKPMVDPLSAFKSNVNNK